MKTEITKIKLQLKGRDIELTAAEAREVQAELNKLFEIEKTELQKFKEQWEKDNPKTSPFPWPSYPAPIIIERNVPYWPRPWEIWCGGTVGGIGVHQTGTLCMAIGHHHNDKVRDGGPVASDSARDATPPFSAPLG